MAAKRAFSNRSDWVGRGFDILWLIALAVYALAGYRNVPFHGDEATQIFMSRDYHLLFQAGDLDAVLYTATPDDPAGQELRYINGTIAKYSIGMAWDLAGLSVEDLNDQWAWGAGWDWNVRDGHMPSDRLLYAARLASALMLAASVWGVFAIGWIAGGGRWAAVAASLVYVTTPAVLINGRRAMMEGTMLLATMLVVLAALLWLRAQARGRVRWWHVVALGVASGLALSSKHNTALAVGIAGLVVAGATFGQRDWRHMWRRDWLRLGVVVLLAAGVFLLLNPAWWSDPIGMPARVWDARQSLLHVQQVMYDSYDGLVEPVDGLIRRVAVGEPQYYEVASWRGWLFDHIYAYEAHTWTGIDGGVIGAWLRLVGLVFGSAVLLDRGLAPLRDPAAWLMLAWFWGTALALLVLTPFDWQRYYLPLQPALAVVIGAAVAWCVEPVGMDGRKQRV